MPGFCREEIGAWQSEISLTPERGADSSVRGVFVTQLDVTERSNIEAQLRRSEAQARAAGAGQGSCLVLELPLGAAAKP